MKLLKFSRNYNLFIMKTSSQINIKKVLMFISLVLLVVTVNAQKEKVPTFKKDGLSNYNMGNYSIAAKYLNKWINENPAKADTTVLAALADCYWKQRAYTKSYQTYEKLQSIAGYSMPTSLRMRLSDLYAMQNKYNSASNELNGIAELSSRKNSFSNINSFIKDSADWSILYPAFNNSSSSEYLPYLFENNLYITTNRGTATKWSKTYLATGGQYSKIEAIDTSKIVIAVNTDTDYRRKYGVFNLYDTGNLHKLKYPAIHEEGSDRLSLVNTPENLTSGNKAKVVESKGDLRLIEISSKTNIGNKGSVSFSKSINGSTEAYFTGNILSSFNEGDDNFLPNGKEVNNVKKIIPTFLYKGTLNGDNIDNVMKMDIKGFTGNIVHATVSQDGKILVFSGKKNGKDDYDLFWAVRTSDNTWDSVQTFGSNVNTIGNEVFPTLQKNGWLYFSSDGLPGLGALDIYKMPLYVNNTMNSTATPEHLSYPVNSAFDDYGVTAFNSGANEKNIVSDPVRGFLSTNRFGTDDIYAFMEKPVYFVLSNGSVKGLVPGEEEKLLEGATVKLYELDENGNRKLDSVSLTNNNGGYKFLLKPNTNYQLHAEKEGWQSGAEAVRNITVESKNKPGETLIPSLYLNKIIEKVKEVSEPPVLPEVAYSKILDKKELDEFKGKFVKEYIVHHYFDKTKIIETDKPIIDSVVNWIKDYKNVSLTFLVSATDCYGSATYNKTLSERRAQHVKSVLKSYGVNADIIKIKWVGKDQLVENVGCPENKTKTQQQPNRYTRIIINYNK